MREWSFRENGGAGPIFSRLLSQVRFLPDNSDQVEPNFFISGGEPCDDLLISLR